MSKRTPTQEGLDYERINDKKVRCILKNEAGEECGCTIPAPDAHPTRHRRHYSGLGANNNPQGVGANVALCTKISPEQRKAFRDEDIKDDLYVAKPEGFERFVAGRDTPQLEYFYHDASKLRVMCMYCGATMAYQSDRMLSHLMHGDRHVRVCAKFPDELRSQLSHVRARKHALVTGALFEFARRLEEDEDRATVRRVFHSAAFGSLVHTLVEMPAVRDFNMPAME